MLQSSITDFLCVDSKTSPRFQPVQILHMQGKVSFSLHSLNWGLQSIILLHAGSFDWKCLSTWLAKENLILMKTAYFLVFILPSKQKISWSYHRHTQALKCQMPVSYLLHALFPTDTHSQVLWHETKHKGSRHTPASQQFREKHVKLSISWTIGGVSMGKGLTALPQFCNSHEKAWLLLLPLHNSRAFTNN